MRSRALSLFSVSLSLSLALAISRSRSLARSRSLTHLAVGSDEPEVRGGHDAVAVHQQLRGNALREAQVVEHLVSWKVWR